MSTARSYYSARICDFVIEPSESIVGTLASAHSQDLVHSQTNAWRAQIAILKEQLACLGAGHIYFEFAIPRMGKRADAVLFVDGIVLILEFKIGSVEFHQQDVNQAEGYALDLKHFHEGSHDLPIMTVLVATRADAREPVLIPGSDEVYAPICSDGQNLADIIRLALNEYPTSKLDASLWAAMPYKPTPTIIEAAQALYSNHNVTDIARNDAGAKNLTVTSDRLREIIAYSHQRERKSICFVTGVPGAGKTLVGLDIATSSPQEEHAVFLSGNGPLVEVLREALARDEVRRVPGMRKAESSRKVKGFVQNIHHFRDEALASTDPPTERVVVFDEAQRAWDRAHTEKFMVGKRGQASFDLSEPEFLIQIMDRHEGWCVIIALVGGGQEINSGEIGLAGWRDAIANRYPTWDVYFSDRLNEAEYAGGAFDAAHLANEVRSPEPSLHLATSMRSFRAETLSTVVHHIIAGNAERAGNEYERITRKFPICVTRDIHAAKCWVRDHARGVDTKGLIASSGAHRLKPYSIYAKNKISAADWFLNGPDDVRSGHYLEDVATEFDIQGLELDWCLVAWDADFRFHWGGFEHWEFVGTRWNRRNQEASRRYLENAYRVLLTRARQGMVIFVPEGDPLDHTRLPEFYDETFRFLVSCGLPRLDGAESVAPSWASVNG
jgi:hypothetical protein